MRTAIIARWQALLCALLVVLAALAVNPHAEIGIQDDWSYIRMAQVLARTGHYGYNGWETPMLGYVVFLGAGMVKLFGSSFTTVRMTDQLLAIVTAFLMQRTFVRMGLSSWNATLGTLAFVFSPVYLPYVFTFMSDVPGIFGMIVCLYCGARALRAGTERRAIAWLCLTSAAGVVGGTGRQTAWLGALVIVPSITFCLRRSKRVLVAGAALTVVGASAVTGILYWFNHQLYSQPEAVVRSASIAKDVSNFLFVTVHTVPVFLFLLLPVMVLYFVPAMRSSGRNRMVILAGTLVFILLAHVEYHRQRFEGWTDLFPATTGALTPLTFLGAQPPALRPIPILMLWLVMVSATLAFCAFCVAASWKASSLSESGGLTWRELAALLIPFTAGYLVLLLPRAVYEEVFSRYLLPLMMVALPVMIRIYQERVSSRLPRFAVAPIALLGLYSIVLIHDSFATNRAKIQAAGELLAAGIPADQIDGGGEFDGTTQLNADGYIHDLRTRLPNGAKVVNAPADPRFCAPFLQYIFPAIKPRFALSFDPNACGGLSSFAPVTFRQWLAPHSQQIYIVKEKGER